MLYLQTDSDIFIFFTEVLMGITLPSWLSYKYSFLFVLIFSLPSQLLWKFELLSSVFIEYKNKVHNVRRLHIYIEIYVIYIVISSDINELWQILQENI